MQELFGGKQSAFYCVVELNRIDHPLHIHHACLLQAGDLPNVAASGEYLCLFEGNILRTSCNCMQHLLLFLDQAMQSNKFENSSSSSPGASTFSMSVAGAINDQATLQIVVQVT